MGLAEIEQIVIGVVDRVVLVVQVKVQVALQVLIPLVGQVKLMVVLPVLVGLAEEHRCWVALLEQQNTGWTAFSLKTTDAGQELMGCMPQVMLCVPEVWELQVVPALDAQFRGQEPLSMLWNMLNKTENIP